MPRKRSHQSQRPRLAMTMGAPMIAAGALAGAKPAGWCVAVILLGLAALLGALMPQDSHDRGAVWREVLNLMRDRMRHRDQMSIEGNKDVDAGDSGGS
jgi:hypothetical protein